MRATLARQALAAAAFLVTFAAVEPLRADESNRNLLPFGERAAMLGNAGITSAKGEAVYYNPANLARIEQPELSVSGSTYLKFELSTDALLELQGVDQPFDASGFVAIPATLVSTYDLGDWALATAVLVPDTFELKNRVTFEAPDLRVTQLSDTRRNSLWLGLGAARQLTEELSIGLSAFASNETRSDLSFVRVQVGDPAQVIREVASNRDSSVFNLSAIAGVYWQPHPRLGLGARVHSAMLRLAGSGDIYQSLLQTGMDGAMDESIEVAIDDIAMSRPLPWDVGLGVSFRPRDDLELMADLNVQLPATLTAIDDPDLGVESVEVEAAPRASLAVEWAATSRLWLRAGLMINRSAYPTPEEPGDPVEESYAGATGGLAWQKGRTTTGLGLFYLHSNPTFFVDGADPPRRADAVARLYGAVLAFTYSL